MNFIRFMWSYPLWLCWYFFVVRCIFIVYHYKLYTPPISYLNVFQTFKYGFFLDISAACYCTFISGVLGLLYVLTEKKIFMRLINIYTVILLFVISFLVVADLELYKQWGIKINSTAFDFMQHPTEAGASIQSSPISLLVSIAIILIIYFFYRYKLNVISKLQKQQASFSTLKKIFLYLPIYFIITGFLIVGIRGGLQLAPINPSSVYFSNYPILNHTALNTVWNFIYSITKKNNPHTYNYFSEKKSETLVDSLYKNIKNEIDTTSLQNILTTNTPNVMLVVLEGFTSDVVEDLGGEKNLTPNLKKLIDNGLLFTNIYANGDRTYKGIVSILSAYPTQPTTPVINYPEKTAKLPSIANTLSQKQYDTHFYYGGETEFGNIKSYILNANFKHITEKKDFSSESFGLKWGAHDDVVLKRAITDLSAMNEKQEKPFFCTILTLSSHEPYDVPMPTAIQGTDLPNMFRNSVVYTDKSIGEFMDLAQKQTWYNNTLFIFTADHGNQLPKQYTNNFTPKRFKIPLIFYGNVLKKQYINKKNNTLGSQNDIAKTLLTQLNLHTKSFKWSNDLVNTPAENTFAFYTFDNGFGWLRPTNQILVYDNLSNKIIFTENIDLNTADSLMLTQGKCFMQATFNDFLHLDKQK